MDSIIQMSAPEVLPDEMVSRTTFRVLGGELSGDLIGRLEEIVPTRVQNDQVVPVTFEGVYSTQIMVSVKYRVWQKQVIFRPILWNFGSIF